MSDHYYGNEIVEKQIANVANELKRHCKIGKVKRKARNAFGGLLPDIMKTQPILPTWPHDGSSLPKPMYMGKCGCKVGTVCGNVASPHRLVAYSTASAAA